MDGWGLLDRLKHEPATRHIPVHIISVQEQLGRGLNMGILGFSSKPADRQELLASFQRLKDFVERRKRRLLLVGSAGDHSDRSVLLTNTPENGTESWRERGCKNVV